MAKQRFLSRPLRALVATVALAVATIGTAAADGDPWTPVNPQTPDSQVNVAGTPFKGTNPDGTVNGYVDAHTHLMSNEGFGGNLVCGKTYSSAGIADALKDCDYHQPNGAGATIENLTHLEGSATHDPTGWPTFKDWPKWSSLTHQQMYYKWVERAWRGGQRIMVADAVNNSVLCGLPTQLPKYSCDDMDTVRRQIAETKKLEAFVDAQYGGAGKGWFRIAYSSDEARRYIEQGKLAVILGVEVSAPFGCGHTLGIPHCDRAKIDAGLDELHSLGVRSMFLCHKFDNALCGVRFDSGTTGTIVNAGNFLATGQFWQVEACKGAAHDNTIENHGIPPELSFLNIVLPFYPAAPHCNKRGLTDLGQYGLNGLMERGMLVEIDHMSVKAASRTLDLLELSNYPGVVSSHSWMDKTFTERLYRLGGFVTQYGHGAGSFVDEADDERALREKYKVGYGFGMDMNGFGGTPAPRAGSAVTYPFSTLGGATTADRQVTGQRTWDYNTDGVAHYGMIPDWVEDLRKVGGQPVVDELARGAESYLRTAKAAQTWTSPANVAQGRPASASSHEWSWIYDFRAPSAVDGSWDTRWASGWSDNQWWQVDLGSVQPIGRVGMDWEAAYGRDYRIEVSTDGSNWRTVVNATNQDGWLDMHVFTPTGARYVRIVGVKRGTQYGYSLREVYVQSR